MLILLRLATILYQTMLNPRNPNAGLRIGVLTYDYSPPIGGLGILAKTYVDALRRLYPDATITVISPSANADDRVSIFARLRFRKPGGCPLFSLIAFLALPRLIRKYQLDVLHVHAGSGGVFLLRHPGCRTVVTAHHTYKQEADLVFIKGSLQWLWKLFMSTLERRTYSVADQICCVSADTMNAIVHAYTIAVEKCCVVENPISTTIIEDYLGLEKSEQTLLFVGRLEERKGIMVLLQAFGELSKEYPHAMLRLIGRNLLGDALMTYCREHSLQDRVQILGHLDDHVRFREMAEATVLVVPSLLEGFGLVAAEAMMIGTPLIVSDAPGLRSIVNDQKTGFIFQSKNSVDLERVLCLVLQDKAMRSSLAMNARVMAINRFSVDGRTKDMMYVFEDRTN
jgi:glycosyltransferase involved in cell wall biosynthesis